MTPPTTIRNGLWLELATAAVPRYEHGDYAVGWLCALPHELTAAQAMLDCVHPVLPNPSADRNVYTFGSISGHNVVITCLPVGQYGTTPAAVVVASMLSTFKSINIPLLVGVGGGVPGPVISESGPKPSTGSPDPHPDIRLCDVIVSVSTPDCAAVIQYDFGKRTADGKLSMKGTLNKPRSNLLQAVASLRSDNSSGGARNQKTALLEIVDGTLVGNPALGEDGFGKPDILDQLFEAGCRHVEELEVCKICGPVKQISRSPRPLYDSVRVHHGPIASGNQVIKNSLVRNEIAWPLGIMCFEMEAAGVMDLFQPLVIRGVCDYCEPRKHKLFQKHAALVAAAYTKQLLSKIPRTQHEVQASQRQTRLQDLVNGLDFDDAQSRLKTIRIPHAETCRWILSQDEYVQWLDNAKKIDHCGFLWIKGKPGVGKSTLMKYLYLNHAGKDSILISFFFNARGTDLVRSTCGMYRSLLSQLLAKLPGLRYKLEFPASVAAYCDVNELRNLFVHTVQQLRGVSVTCFIDALDESPEDDVRELIETLQILARQTASGDIDFRVCCSSRYYPRISIQVGLEFQMEKTDGHYEDLVKYVEAELVIGSSPQAVELKEEIVSRSADIFLWVVLVVQILKKEYDHGRIRRVYRLREKLSSLPTKLSDLFKDILFRDEENRDDLIHCIQWILYAQRPLTVPEFYFGMAAACDDEDVAVPWDPDEDTLEIMKWFIISSSKGLVEPTRSRPPVVQLIHESVREFLLDNSAMTHMWSGFDVVARGPGHEALCRYCYRYITTNILTTPIHLDSAVDKMTALGLRNDLCRKFPFAKYALESVLSHGMLAHSYGTLQTSFFKQFLMQAWADQMKIISSQNHDMLWSELCRAMSFNSSDLSPAPSWSARDHTIGLALSRGKPEELLDSLGLGGIGKKHSQAIMNDISDLYQTWEGPRAESFAAYLAERGSGALASYLLDHQSWLVQQGQYDVLKLKIRHGNIQQRSSISETDIFCLEPQEKQTLLFFAARRGNVDIVQRLLGFGVCVQQRTTVAARRVPLAIAALNSHEAVVECLLNAGADPNTAMLMDGKNMSTRALHAAAKNGNMRIIVALLEAGASLRATQWIHSEDTPKTVAQSHNRVYALEYFNHMMSLEKQGNGFKTEAVWDPHDQLHSSHETVSSSESSRCVSAPPSPPSPFGLAQLFMDDISLDASTPLSEAALGESATPCTDDIESPKNGMI